MSLVKRLGRWFLLEKSLIVKTLNVVLHVPLPMGLVIPIEVVTGVVPDVVASVRVSANLEPPVRHMKEIEIVD